MKAHQNVYRKNFSLIVAFLILISVTLVFALIVAYSFTKKSVEGEFVSKKTDVLTQTTSRYNDFFNNRLKELSLYNGLMDTTLARPYITSVFKDYPFIKEVVFYKILLGNKNDEKGRLSIATQGIFHYSNAGGKVTVSRPKDAIDTSDFKQMADKLRRYITSYDTLKAEVQNDNFYDIRPGKISFFNILSGSDMKTYHEMEKNKGGASYKQNMMTFSLDAHALSIVNKHTGLYPKGGISIESVVNNPINVDTAKTITDEVPLPGAFSDYKLYFSSPRDYLTAEVNRRFMPTAGIVLLIYIFLVVIGWLIYRNLNVNLKLFKLQYDFINNFTHEFKTPVSVIKIAGSNLKGDGELTDRQRKHYGKILDEEADKLNELMNKLLSFTQLENKSISIKKDKINVDTFAQGYINTFRIKYPDFKLRCHIQGVKFFYTDPVLLGSIFQNLIENAYKYSHRDNKELTIDISQEKRNIIFSFKDKGIGIPKNELNNIFKKFYRLENQYNQNGSVGLGLAFCKELANFMDGEITVESRVEQGSEFRVTFPYEQ